MKEYHEVDIPVGTFGNLGITVIGQTTPDGHDVGIYCGGIVPNSAAASLGRLVEVGDRLVMVDGEDFWCVDLLFYLLRYIYGIDRQNCIIHR
jgi:hypothetical protein